MQTAIFNPVVKRSQDHGDGCSLSGNEWGTHNSFGMHFETAEAMETFGMAVAAEARRLLAGQAAGNRPGQLMEILEDADVPTGYGEAAP